jgi:hypothetical protein
MLLLAQIPGADDAIKAAAESSWLAVLLVVVVLCMLLGFGLILRWILKRQADTEERLTRENADREVRNSELITHLQETIRNELISLIKLNTDTMARMISAADGIVRASERMTTTLDRFSSLMDSGACPISAKHTPGDV